MPKSKTPSAAPEPGQHPGPDVGASAEAGLDPAGHPRFYQSASYRREDSLGWLLRKLKQSIVHQAGRQLGDHGLTHAQWGVLMVLRFGSNHCTTTALCRELDADAGALSRLLDRLEAKGLVLRERLAEDRRVVQVSLTDAGFAASDQLPALLSDVFNAHLKGFSHAEWQLLLSMLRRMIDNGEALRRAQSTPDID